MTNRADHLQEVQLRKPALPSLGYGENLLLMRSHCRAVENSVSGSNDNGRTAVLTYKREYSSEMTR